MQKENVIIWASSRLEGETKKSVDLLNNNNQFDLISLNNIDMTFFDYEYKNLNDDFFDISNRLTYYKNIVFATPVYWYSMCAQMKIFFDRTSDIISERKEVGRALAGKNTFLITNGTGKFIPEGFEVPFRDTSKYFDMNYQGSLYLYTGNDNSLIIDSWNKIPDFKSKIITS